MRRRSQVKRAHCTPLTPCCQTRLISVSVAGIARVRLDSLERLQNVSQAFAGHRRGRGENRPTGRSGNQSRRSLRLLLVIRLHDRHGAHHTLPEGWKQARQSLARQLFSRLTEAFPYNRCGGGKSPLRRGLFVTFCLQRVTNIFRIRIFRRMSAY